MARRTYAMSTYNYIIRCGPHPDNGDEIRSHFTKTFFICNSTCDPYSCEPSLGATPHNSFLSLIRLLWQGCQEEGCGHMLVGKYDTLGTLDKKTGKPVQKIAHFCGNESSIPPESIANLVRSADGGFTSETNSTGPTGYTPLFCVVRSRSRPRDNRAGVTLAIDYRLLGTDRFQPMIFE